jgi:hypothetical protein
MGRYGLAQGTTKASRVAPKRIVERLVLIRDCFSCHYTPRSFPLALH